MISKRTAPSQNGRSASRLRVGYVVKRYPRYSETFIVNEILAHEAADWDLDIFALRPPTDGHFQDRLARVRAPVHYLCAEKVKGETFWQALRAAGSEDVRFYKLLTDADAESAQELYQALELADLVRRNNLQHLHAHFATGAAAVARLAARFTGISYSLTAHAKDIYHNDNDRWALGRRLADAAAVITVSDFNVQYLQREFAELPLRLQRVYNGLDLQDFRYRSPAQRPPQIIAVGRLVEKKGFRDLVAAGALLARRGVTFGCQIVGSGSLESDLRTQIEQAGLAAHFSLAGPQPQSAVQEFIQRAAVLAAPCVVGEDGNRDGLPTVLLEAMALGTPCVSTPVTGIPEAIQEGSTGRLVPEGDPESLAGALETLLVDANQRVRLAEAARARIEREFDVHRNTGLIREIMLRCAAAPSVQSESKPAGVA